MPKWPNAATTLGRQLRWLWNRAYSSDTPASAKVAIPE